MAAPSEDFETADYDSLRACSLAARGLWTDMRVLMKKSRRPGFLHLKGKPMSLMQLAHTTGCKDTDVARSLVEELVKAGICAVAKGNGAFYSPRIVAFESFRRKCGKAGRKGGGNPVLRKSSDPAEPLKVTPKDGPKDESDPPPMVSPPNTPSSFPPPSHTLREGGDREDAVSGDELDDRIRAYFAGHRLLIWNAKQHGNFRRMVEAAGWDLTERAMASAVANGAGEPTSYAVKVLSGMQAKKRLGRAANGESTAPAAAPKPTTVRF